MEDRRDRAFGNARFAVDALFRMDEEDLLPFGEAFNRANDDRNPCICIRSTVPRQRESWQPSLRGASTGVTGTWVFRYGRVRARLVPAAVAGPTCRNRWQPPDDSLSPACGGVRRGF